MEFNIKKTTPKELFITILNTDEQNWKAESKNKPSGNDFIDKLMELLSIYGNKTAKFYEKELNIESGGLNHIVFMFSEIDFKAFRNEYLILASKELLIETDYSLQKIGKRLGFSGISTFSRWFIQNEKKYPSSWRSLAKRKAKIIDKKLLSEIKKDKQRPSI